MTAAVATPRVTAYTAVHHIYLTLDKSAPPVRGDRGERIAVRWVQAIWAEGQLQSVRVGGRRIGHDDGAGWGVTGQAERQFRIPLAGDAPGWLRELVDRYDPRRGEEAEP